MSSEILTDELPRKGGSHQAPTTPAKDEGFHPTHFFVLVSLLAATVAVVLARPAGPENLILISLTIGAVGIASYGFYRMLLPLVSPAREMDREPLSARLRADLEREKALTLRSIKELEFDRAMGKLSERDFEEMSGRLRSRALGIMKQLDAGTGVYRAQIEKDLAARLGANKPDLQVGRTANQRPADSATRDLKVAPTGRVCTCGTGNDPDARFCKTCGTKLEAA
jgi:hypothetical protein